MARILTIGAAYALVTTIGSILSQSRQEVPPDHVRIRGVIVSQSLSKKETGTCLQYPCWALIKIEKVFGYGSGFSGSIGLGDIVEVRFASTLLPTESLFPNRENHLPGLSSGETFLADLKQKLGIDLSGQNSTYEIDEYAKMN